ncbi:MAG: hypothetical protein ACI9EW_001397 [Cellvibrionaceae bacterium]|jgi:hypothetical protein
MNEKYKALPEILTIHADALASGHDISYEIMDKHGEDYPSLRILLDISRSLSRAFIPYRAPADFVHILRTDLKLYNQQPVPKPIRSRVRLNPWVLVTAIASTVATVIGIIVWFKVRGGKQTVSADI